MKRKQIASLFFALCLVFSILTLTTDTSAKQSAYLETLSTLNSLCDTDYGKDQLVTREEFCVCAAKVFNITGESADVNLPFEDSGAIKPENLTYIAALYENGFLGGAAKNGKLYMLPGDTITRQEAFALLGKIIGKTSEYKLTFSDANSLASWAKGYVAWFVENGIIGGYPGGILGPKDTMTAVQMAAFFVKTLEYNANAVSTLLGTGSRGFSDGGARDASFTLPYGVVADEAGAIIVFDTYNNAIREISDETAITMGGSIKALDDNRFYKGYYLDGDLKSSLFNRPSGGVINSQGDLLICDSGNHVIRIIKDGKTYTFSGTTQGHSDGAGDKAMFDTPMAIAIDKNDNIYVADTLNNCIRKIDSKGNVKTIAGSPEKSGFADGAALSALFSQPSGIAVTDDGKTVYVADTGNHRIRKIENGMVTTLAGTISEKDENGNPLGGFMDGEANDAMFCQPMGITLADGVLVIADSGNNRIRAITQSGRVVTAAGDGEADDRDGMALSAEFDHPMGVCFSKGTLYIADTTNNKIKKMPFDAAAYE